MNFNNLKINFIKKILQNNYHLIEIYQIYNNKIHQLNLKLIIKYFKTTKNLKTRFMQTNKKIVKIYKIKIK